MDGSGGGVSTYMVGLMHMCVVDFKNGKFQYSYQDSYDNVQFVKRFEFFSLLRKKSQKHHHSLEHHMA